MDRAWWSHPISTSSSKLKRSILQMNSAQRFALNAKQYARSYFINILILYKQGVSPHGTDKGPGAIYITLHETDGDIIAMNFEVNISRRLHCLLRQLKPNTLLLQGLGACYVFKVGLCIQIGNYSESLGVLLIL